MTRTELLERAPPAVLPQAGERVLCAVSGGLDSMCLLSMLEAWCEERGGQVTAAHFNHLLRGAESDRDEAFVRETCEKRGVPLAAGRGGAGALARREGLSVEEAARALRYAFLRRAAEAEGCTRVYTAHHADDNAETVLLNLLRGTGLRGLTGMDWQRDKLCRPLLGTSREELEAYAAQWGIPHVEDGTNADPGAASRNLLRLRVMPLLRELNPRAAEHINRTAAQLRTVDRYLEEEARRRTAHAELGRNRAALSLDALLTAPEAVRPRMLLELLDLLGAGRKDIGAVHLEALLELCQKGGPGDGARISLPRNIMARLRGGLLELEVRPQPLAEAQLAPGRSLRWGDYTLTLLDRREGGGLALRPPAPGEPREVSVRPCGSGDRLTLPGSRGGRTVKRLCLDRRLSPEERDRLPALCVDGRLAAVWRLGTDVEFLPAGESVRFIKIEENREADGS